MERLFCPLCDGLMITHPLALGMVYHCLNDRCGRTLEVPHPNPTFSASWVVRTRYTEHPTRSEQGEGRREWPVNMRVDAADPLEALGAFAEMWRHMEETTSAADLRELHQNIKVEALP